MTLLLPRVRADMSARALAIVVTSVLVMGAALVLPSTVAAADVIIDPDTNDLVLGEGDTLNETITVTVPAGAGVAAADIYFLMDTTGSMFGPISALKASATDVMNGLVADHPEIDLAFGAGDFKDFPFDSYAFHHAVSLTDDTAAVQAAINAWSASGGSDGPEGQFYAYDQIAENRAPSNDGSAAGTIGWRTGAKPILVIFGDAPGHDPVCSEITDAVPGHELAYDITEASLTAKLQAAGITVIAISTETGFMNGMDADPQPSSSDYFTDCGAPGGTAGQATRIANATGGVHLVDVATDAIADAVEEQVTTAVETISSLSLQPTGDIAPFISSITPASYGPLDSDVEHVLGFDVDWEGTVAATGADQVFTGTLDVVADGSVVAQKTVTITVPAAATGECVDLIAAQDMDVGDVCVSNDGTNLSVTYTTVDGWTLTKTHLAVSEDEPGGGEWTARANRWQNNTGNPSPGRFPYQAEHDPAVTTFTYTIPLADISGGVAAGDELFIGAHAVVERETVVVLAAAPYDAATVEATTQGLRKDGTAVRAERSDPAQGLTPGTGAEPTFYSLGFGGSIEVGFDCAVTNGTGTDLRIGEVTNGTYPLETADVYAWDDATSNWVLLGEATNTNPVSAGRSESDFDLGALASTSRIRIVDTSDSSLFESTADGFDLDGVTALHDCTTTLVERESAWGEGDRFVEVGNWAMYFTYEVQ